MTEVTIIFLLIYLLTVLLAATEAIPLSMSALLGALLTVWFGFQYGGIFTDYKDVLSLIDMNIIFLVIGTMIVVEVARKSNIFHFGALYAVKLAGGNPAKLFVAICLASAVASLFLSDSTAMLLMAAAVATIAKLLNYDPVPYFLSSVIMINLGGTSTLIGSVSNMIIGIKGEMSFTEFLIYLTPCEIMLWFLMIFILYKFFKSRLGEKKALPEYNPWETVKDKKLFAKSAIVLSLFLVLLLSLDMLPALKDLNITPDAIAVGCGIIAVLVTGFDPAEIFREIDWETVFFIAGFFIVIGGLQRTEFLPYISKLIIDIAGNNQLAIVLLTLWFSGLASTIVSNIAIALTFAPIIEGAVGVNSPATWSALVLGTNLGGATTPFSSAACVMAAGALKREGIPLSFAEFTKIGAITTFIQLIFASLYLMLRFGLVI